MYGYGVNRSGATVCECVWSLVCFASLITRWKGRRCGGSLGAGRWLGLRDGIGATLRTWMRLAGFDFSPHTRDVPKRRFDLINGSTSADSLARASGTVQWPSILDHRRTHFLYTRTTILRITTTRHLWNCSSFITVIHSRND